MTENTTEQDKIKDNLIQIYLNSYKSALEHMYLKGFLEGQNSIITANLDTAQEKLNQLSNKSHDKVD